MDFDFKNIDFEYLWTVISLHTVNIVVAIFIFIVGKWLARKITNVILDIFQKKGADITIINFSRNIIYYVLILVVIFTALDQVGIDTTSMIAVLGAAGLAVGLALKDSLSNFASGIMIIIFKPFVVGDYIEAGGVGGTVKYVNIFNTILFTPDNKKIVIPNGNITNDNIVNYSANPTRRVDMVFGVGYGDDLKKTKELLTKIITEDPRVLADPAPVVGLSELGDSSVNFVVRPWVNKDDYWAFKFDINQKIKEEFDEAGISIPFPQRDVHHYYDTNTRQIIENIAQKSEDKII